MKSIHESRREDFLINQSRGWLDLRRCNPIIERRKNLKREIEATPNIEALLWCI